MPLTVSGDLPFATAKALWGCAVGDAFGAPFEYNSRARLLAAVSIFEERYLNYHDVEAESHRARVTGQYTDDTQQAMILVEAKRRGHSPDEAKQFFIDTCRKMLDAGRGDFGVHRGTGRNFRESIQTGEPMFSAGLGACMRVAPVATMFDDPQTMIVWVGEVSTATTYHPVSVACAIKVALAAWVLSHPGERDRILKLQYPVVLRGPRGTNGRPLWESQTTDEVWQATVDAMVASKQGSDALFDYGRNTPWLDKPLESVTDGYALTGFAWAIRAAFSATSFEEAMQMACDPGGDTDTICAITGALAALRHPIPEWMVKTSCTTGPWFQGDVDAFIEKERSLTEHEQALRSGLADLRSGGP